MKKLFKILLVVALCLILLGGITFTIGIFAADGKFSDISLEDVKMHTYAERAESPVTAIKLDFDTTDVEIRLEDTKQLSIEYPQLFSKKGKPRTEMKVTETENSVAITEYRPWYNNISIISLNPTAILHLPKSRVYALDISTDTGDVTFHGEKLQTRILAIETDTGYVNASETELVCENKITIDTDTADVRLGKLSCSSLSVEVDTGDIFVTDGNVTENAVFDLDTGDFTLTGTLQANSFKASSDTGKINTLNGCISARNIHLESTTGDVSATLAGSQTEYTVTAKTNTGSKNIFSGGNGEKTLEISTNTGDIRIEFKN